MPSGPVKMSWELSRGPGDWQAIAARLATSASDRAVELDRNDSVRCRAPPRERRKSVSNRHLPMHEARGHDRMIRIRPVGARLGLQSLKVTTGTRVGAGAPTRNRRRNQPRTPIENPTRATRTRATRERTNRGRDPREPRPRQPRSPRAPSMRATRGGRVLYGLNGAVGTLSPTAMLTTLAWLFSEPEAWFTDITPVAPLNEAETVSVRT